MGSHIIGRNRELGYLEELYLAEESNIVALYGRPQTGKTALLEELAEGKRAVFFRLNDMTEYEAKEYMRQELSLALDREQPAFQSFVEPFVILKDTCARQKLLVIFDDFSNMMYSKDFMANAEEFLESLGSESTVVLCGSSDIVEKAIDDPTSPLYRTPCSRLELKELTFRDTVGFHPGMSDIDLIKTYLTVGGVPAYHLAMYSDTYEENMNRCFLGPNALLRDAADRALDLTPHNMNSGILACIADGIATQTEIAQSIGVTKALCKRYLDAMEKAGIVTVLNPMFGARKKMVYRISSAIQSFRYHLVRRHQSQFTAGILTPEAEEELQAFFTERFDMMCSSYFAENYNVTEMGMYADLFDPESKGIDITMVADGKLIPDVNVFAKCKFRKRKVGMGVLNTLMMRAEPIDVPNKRFVLCSASGFDSDLENLARNSGIVLVGPDQLTGRKAPKQF